MENKILNENLLIKNDLKEKELQDSLETADTYYDNEYKNLNDFSKSLNIENNLEISDRTSLENKFFSYLCVFLLFNPFFNLITHLEQFKKKFNLITYQQKIKYCKYQLSISLLFIILTFLFIDEDKYKKMFLLINLLYTVLNLYALLEIKFSDLLKKII